MIRWIIILLAGFGMVSASAAELLKDPNQILQKSEALRRIPSLQADVSLKTQGNNFSDEKEFQFFRKLAEDGERFKTLTRFQKPATIKNQAILFLEKENFESSVFMYLPTFKKVRRVESHSQSSSFMGSAFSYSDISTPQAKDYKNVLIESKTCPDSAGQSCYVIESKPLTNEVKERTNYEKMRIWIQSDNMLPVQWELYGKAQDPVRKIMRASEFLKVLDQKWFAQKLEIEDFSAKKKTILRFSNVSAKETLSETLFTQQSLSREIN